MKRLIEVWLGLMLLLAISTFSALLPLGILNTILNVAIAVAKSLLVLMYFMQLRRSIALLRLVAMVSLLTLTLFFVLAGADFITRTIERAPWQAAQPSVAEDYSPAAR
ncbi:MAG TPA: cytochrome C oxidase subunit IV family protein [Burkholderiaceae bacterium]|nr:cytochrome C oxidase subunit IV family protein [Burkholderiaceae bacterium]